jgi:hypothetical protein
MSSLQEYLQKLNDAQLNDIKKKHNISTTIASGNKKDILIKHILEHFVNVVGDELISKIYKQKIPDDLVKYRPMPLSYFQRAKNKVSELTNTIFKEQEVKARTPYFKKYNIDNRNFQRENENMFAGLENEFKRGVTYNAERVKPSTSTASQRRPIKEDEDTKATNQLLTLIKTNKELSDEDRKELINQIESSKTREDQLLSNEFIKRSDAKLTPNERLKRVVDNWTETDPENNNLINIEFYLESIGGGSLKENLMAYLNDNGEFDIANIIPIIPKEITDAILEETTYVDYIIGVIILMFGPDGTNINIKFCSNSIGDTATEKELMKVFGDKRGKVIFKEKKDNFDNANVIEYITNIAGAYYFLPILQFMSKSRFEHVTDTLDHYSTYVDMLMMGSPDADYKDDDPEEYARQEKMIEDDDVHFGYIDFLELTTTFNLEIWTENNTAYLLGLASDIVELYSGTYGHYADPGLSVSDVGQNDKTTRDSWTEETVKKLFVGATPQQIKDIVKDKPID